MFFVNQIVNCIMSPIICDQKTNNPNYKGNKNLKRDGIIGI